MSESPDLELPLGDEALPARKPPARKSPARKAAARKGAAGSNDSPAEDGGVDAPVKKAAARKSPARKAGARKPVAAKTARKLAGKAAGEAGPAAGSVPEAGSAGSAETSAPTASRAEAVRSAAEGAAPGPVQALTPSASEGEAPGVAPGPSSESASQQSAPSAGPAEAVLIAPAAIPPIRRVVRRVVREVGSDRYQVIGESGPIREGIAPRPSAALEAARQAAEAGDDESDHGAGGGEPREGAGGEEGGGRRDRNRRNRRNRRGRAFDGAEGGEERDAADRGEDAGPEEGELGPPQDCAGYLELYPKGYGFLRSKDRHFEPAKSDAFISAGLIRSHGLRPGLYIEGVSRMARRGPLLTGLKTINGEEPEAYRNLPVFEELTATFPDHRIRLETTRDRLTTRVIDIFSPIGRGQRGLIVAPPRSGKTTVLQHIAEAIHENHEGEMHLMLLLVDERPEEVTELSRALPEAEVFASSNDSPPRQHLVMAEACIERAKRLVERGKHVFILMDSITRLARAYNNATQGKGRTGSGGLDIRALEIPRKIFAAARNTREAGSLTIVATALVFTGSRMDEVIFQEFKGTGNMELVLDRRIAEKYVYPAADIFKSGTRKEELLLPGIQLPKIHFLRRGLAGMWPDQAMERLVQVMKKIPSNAQLLLDIKDPR